MLNLSNLLEYYLYDIPFIIGLIIICYFHIEQNSKKIVTIYIPLSLAIILSIHWSIWGIGPDYSWRIQLNSILLDFISHGLPLFAVLFIAKRINKKKTNLLLYSLLLGIYLIIALIIIQVLVFIVSWLLYL